MRKSIVFLVMMLVLCSFVFAVTGQVTSFTGQSNLFNITFTGNQNQSFILPIPQYSYVQNISFNIIASNSSILCYQETANISNNCGGLNTGSYYIFKDSAPNNIAFMYINYSKPSITAQAIWQIKHGDLPVHNISIPATCINYSNLTLQLLMISDNNLHRSNASCFNGSWINLSSSEGISGVDGVSGIGDPNRWIDGDYATGTLVFGNAFNNVWSDSGSGIFSAQKIYEEGIFWNLTYNEYLTYSNTIVNLSGIFDLSLNISVINNLLSSSQPINLTFHSDIAGILQVNLTNATYSYGIDNCSNSYNIPSNATAVNFSGLYEGNNSVANIDITSGSYISYSLSSLSSVTTFYPLYSNTQNVPYCIYPSWGNFNLDYSFNYRKYGDTINRQRAGAGLTVSNVLTTIPLYVLSSSSAVTITLTVTDAFSNGLGGVSVYVTRNIAGIDYTVQSAVSGDDGVVSLYLDSTQSYTITASKTGYATSIKTINYPSTAGIYTMALGSQTTTSQSYSAGISYLFSPNTILQTNTSYDFTFNLSSSYWQITDCDFAIKSGGSTLSSVAGNFNSSNCNAVINFDVSTYDNITGEAIYSLNGTSFTVDYPYIVNSYAVGNYSFQTVIDDMANFTGAGFGWQTKMLLAFIIIFGVTAWVSFKFNSLINPEQSLMLQCALVLFFSFAGWLAIPNGMLVFPTVWGALDAGKYAIFVLDGLVTLGYYLWRHS